MLQCDHVCTGKDTVDSYAMIRVPEPREILDWLLRTPAKLRACVAAPARRPLWLILASCALLLGNRLDCISLGHDEISYLLAARSLPGTAAAHATWYAQVLRLPMRLGSDPRIAVAFVAIVWLASLLVLYETLLRYQGWTIAALTCALLGASPWSVRIVREIAPSSLALSLGTLLLSSMVSALVGRKCWSWAMAWLAAVLLSILSPDGFPTLFALAVLTAAGHRRASWPHIWLGILAAGLLTLPTLYEAPAQAPWAQAVAFFSPNQASAQLSLVAPVEGLARLLSGSEVVSQPGGTSGTLSSWIGSFLQWCGRACLLAVPLSLWLDLQAWARWREDGRALRYALPGLCVILAMIPFWLRDAPVKPQALASLLPAAAMTLALAIDAVAQWARLEAERASRWAWTMVVLIVASGVCGALPLYRPGVSMTGVNATVRTLSDWRLLATLATRTQSQVGDGLWVVAPETDPARSDDVTVLNYLLAEQAQPLYVRAGSDAAMLLPAERGARYLLLGDLLPQTAEAIEYRGQLAGLVTTGRTASSALLMQVPSRPVQEILDDIPHREWVAWECGLRLVGHDVPRISEDGQALVFATYWTFEDIPQTDRLTDHRLQISIVGLHGLVAEADRAIGLDESQWRPGLLLRQWHVVPLHFAPVGEAITIELVLERGDDESRVRILDDTGWPIGDRHDLGPWIIPR